ncbi:hypothetical protein VPNG_01596 [Cytospora leucostoma]|uniref:Helicase C-terminal domain-containing protein n=1 Tax=Cytospora leucostoma TaxID=1230097 RepID=A0A423XKE0_9PEZI|nr:hypothetical protein VPNG_01596 [Cytospora leucostoma]
MSVVAATATKVKKQLEEQSTTGKKSSEDLDRKRAAVLKAYGHMVDEEADIEKRIGLPFERPMDRSRLVDLKKSLMRADAVLGDDEALENMNMEEDMRAAQDVIGVPISALRANSCRKQTPRTRKTTGSSSKKRKNTPGDGDGPQKKRKPTQAPKRLTQEDDAVSRYMFDQLAGKNTATNDKKTLKTPRPSLRGLSKARSADLKIMRAAAMKIETEDPEAAKRIDGEIQTIISMTRAFGKACALQLLPGKENSDEEERYIDDYAWAIEGMASALRHHQLISAGFMIGLERGKKYSGGLLFDYMGYGKTVESLALIVGNPASQNVKSSGCITTLVVVPPAAAQQWVEEVKLHCPGLRVCRWTSQVDMSILTGANILVATYVEVRNAYKQAIPQGTKKRNRKRRTGKAEVNLKPGINHPLFKPKFHRVILDEIHEIKQYSNITCEAVLGINAEYKWGLTGTPTPNGVEELYPYLKFICHPEVKTMQDFKNTFVGGKGRNAIPTEIRHQRLGELLAPVMIMRTPSHAFLGTTVLKLPKCHPLPPIKVRLSAEERIIYRFIEVNMQQHIMKKASASPSSKRRLSWRMLHEALVKLRLCVASPLLLQKLANEGFWAADDIASMRREARDAGCHITPFIDQIERWNLNRNKGLHATHHGSIPSENAITDARAVIEAGTCPGYGCKRTIAQLVEPHVSECGHIWCKACLEVQFKLEKTAKNDVAECKRCDKPLGHIKPFAPAEVNHEATHSVVEAGTSQRRPGMDYNGKLPRSGKKAGSANCLGQDSGMKVPRSAKVDAAIRQIVAWLKEAPEDKIIVFIQWVELNGILGRILEEEGITFLFYAGTTEMSKQDRSAAIETFKKDPKVQVLICSLRCGGQALNLTCANRTIMVDLWWNHSVESQATARVYRMGQLKETYSVRILVEDSVDDKIYELQESKLEGLQNALQEFEADKGLDIEAMYKLLGPSWKFDDDASSDDASGDDTSDDQDWDGKTDDSYVD